MRQNDTPSIVIKLLATILYSKIIEAWEKQDAGCISSDLIERLCEHMSHLITNAEYPLQAICNAFTDENIADVDLKENLDSHINNDVGMGSLELIGLILFAQSEIYQSYKHSSRNRQTESFFLDLGTNRLVKLAIICLRKWPFSDDSVAIFPITFFVCSIVNCHLEKLKSMQTCEKSPNDYIAVDLREAFDVCSRRISVTSSLTGVGIIGISTSCLQALFHLNSDKFSHSLDLKDIFHGIRRVLFGLIDNINENRDVVVLRSSVRALNSIINAVSISGEHLNDNGPINRSSYMGSKILDYFINHPSIISGLWD